MSPQALLEQAVLDAGIGPEILAALSRLGWTLAGNSGECPADRIATESSLAQWLSKCSHTEMLDHAGPLTGTVRLAAERIGRHDGALPDGVTLPIDLDAPPAFWASADIQMMWVSMFIDRMDDDPEFHALAYFLDGTLCLIRLETVHRWWLALDEERGKHPASSLVRGWQAQPQEARPFIPARADGGRASLPALHHDSIADDMRLITMPSTAPPPSEEAQGILPGFGGPSVGEDGTISWLLALYELAGGPRAVGGRLPPELVMAVGAMVHLGIHQRDSQWHTLRFAHLEDHRKREDIFGPVPPPSLETWLAPDGGFRRPDQRWQSIMKGLDALLRNLSYLLLQDRSVAWCFPTDIPRSADAPTVEFQVRIPQAAAHGARFDWLAFRRCAKESATLGRAYLSATAHMGRAAHRGMPVTREIAAPILGPDGQPMRRKRKGKGKGAIIRSATETVPNPSARFSKWLSGDTLGRMVGFRNPTKKQRHDAIQAFRRLAADGVIDLEIGRKDSYRILGPGEAADTIAAALSEADEPADDAGE